jgi:uncharacterized protein (TIRG00374 family)
MKRHHIAAVILIFSVLVFYFLVLPSINEAQFIESIKTINPVLLFCAFIAVTISLIIAALRWSFLMQEIHAEKSGIFVNSLGIFCLGQVAGLIVPSRVGNYSKVLMIKKMDEVPYETGLSAVNAETILDLAYICCAGVASFFIMSLFFSAHPYLSSFLLILIAVFLAGIIFILLALRHLEATYDHLTHIASDTKRPRFVRTLMSYLGKFLELILSTKEIFTKRNSLMKLSVTTIFTQIFGVTGLFFVISSFQSTLPFTEVFAILTISYIIGIVSLVPGGFGASDLSLIILLESEGIPVAVSTNIAIFWRFVMYIPIFIIIGSYFFQQQFLKNDFTRQDHK